MDVDNKRRIPTVSCCCAVQAVFSVHDVVDVGVSVFATVQNSMFGVWMCLTMLARIVLKPDVGRLCPHLAPSLLEQQCGLAKGHH
jgi:hypothetical protein